MKRLRKTFFAITLSLGVCLATFNGSMVSAEIQNILPPDNADDLQSTMSEGESIEASEVKKNMLLDEVETNKETITEGIDDELPVVSESNIQTRAFLTVDTITDLQIAIVNANNGDTITLSPTFASNVGTTEVGPVLLTIPGGDSRNLIIDGGNLTFTRGSQFTSKMFQIQHNGAGELTFQNMSLDGFTKAVFDLSGTGKVVLKNIGVFNTTTEAAIINGLTGTLNIMDGVFLENKARSIQDIATVNHRINIENTYFYGNETPYSGGAVVINSNGNVTINKTTFEGNGATSGGFGGALANVSEASNVNIAIESSYFLDNYSVNNVGGAFSIFHLKGGEIKILNTVFEGNEARGTSNVIDGGAIVIKNNSTNYFGNILIDGCNFTNNIAADNGGAMLLEASNGGNTIANVYNSTFVGNESNNVGATLNIGYGGAIQTYDSPKVNIAHNTFYRNRCNGAGSGGALGIRGSNTAFISPVIANNIFIDNNYHKTSTSNNVAINRVTANVANNGNVGYDAGAKFIPDNPTRNDLVKVENIFTAFDASAIALPVTFGSVGSVDHTQVQSAYIPSPRIDEMLRTNDPRTFTGVYEDVRDYPREDIDDDNNPYYPNAGAVEIYWTKFDTGSGSWSSRFQVEDEGGIESLAYPGQFYKISNPPTFDGGGNPIYDENLTFTRNTLTGPAGQGFVGWHDAAKNETKDVNEIYTSRKQTYVAQWQTGLFHLDFDLQEGTPKAGHENDFITQEIQDGINGNLGNEPWSVPERTGYSFEGWYTDETEAGVLWHFQNDAIYSDTTLYARWSVIQMCTLNFDMQGHGKQIDSQYMPVGQSCEKPLDPNETGYIFKGWTLDLASGVLYDFTTPIMGNTTLYAIWETKGGNGDNGGTTKPGEGTIGTLDKMPQTGGNGNLGFVLLLTGMSISGLYLTLRKKQ